MSAQSVHEATGAYVLDALPEPERAAFEAHLATCAECAREVRELAETAALLGAAVSVPPPPELREAVLRRIREVPAGRRRHASAGAGGRPRLRWALAACVAAAVGLGGVAAWQYRLADTARQDARQARAGSAALTELLAAPDARLAVGGTGSVVVSRALDRAVFVPSGMAPPPAGRVYQLWLADPGGGMRPAGLMDPTRPGAVAPLTGPVSGATAVGVTVEPSGGSPTPTTKPLLLLPLPAPRPA
ncbi:anti-sigma factor [Streptomyces sp. NBC_00249]|uniref:anti-sigma factor n=1 Tax=Streptomyces sp. NBC_00249 TaxID=2975690 RepID=UPI0022587443|nr:anti-sigma factor [Streptomyces sp. NBC_00249]MCX5193048.1 anti-sigma factor [Streptomyces sp. NBC_00249]